jgi:hypothetical protein
MYAVQGIEYAEPKVDANNIMPKFESLGYFVSAYG